MAAKKTTKQRTSKSATKKTGRTKGAVKAMTLSGRTRASALGRWIAQREKTAPGFGGEVQSAYSAATHRPGMGWKTKPAESRAATH